MNQRRVVANPSSLPRSLYDIAPLQSASIEEPTFLLGLPLPLLITLCFALFTSLVLDPPGMLALGFYPQIRFDLVVEGFHVCGTQDPGLRKDIPPILGQSGPKNDFLVCISDEKDSFQLDLPFSELGDRAFNFEDGADVDRLIVDEERR